MTDSKYPQAQAIVNSLFGLPPSDESAKVSESWAREQTFRAAMLAEIKSADALAEVRAAKDAAYAERDKCVAGFATLAKALGWPVWLATHVGAWEEDWRNIVCVQTPYGQVSWHYHDSERPWFSSVAFDSPPCAWDGHSTPLKYERLAGLVHDGVEHPAAHEADVWRLRFLGMARAMRDYLVTAPQTGNVPATIAALEKEIAGAGTGAAPAATVCGTCRGRGTICGSPLHYEPERSECTDQAHEIPCAACR